jgi:hypothetical protein
MTAHFMVALVFILFQGTLNTREAPFTENTWITLPHM